MTIRIVRDTATPMLGAIVERMRDPRPALKRIGAYGVGVTQLAFDREEDPETGARWRRLSDVYAAWKKKKGYTSAILELVGGLKKSIHYKVTSGKRRVAWGFSDEKVVYHMSPSPRRKMPLRQALGLNDEDIQEINSIMARWIAEGASK